MIDFELTRINDDSCCTKYYRLSRIDNAQEIRFRCFFCLNWPKGKLTELSFYEKGERILYNIISNGLYQGIRNNIGQNDN